LSYLSDGDNQQVKDVLDLEITARLLSLTIHQKNEIKLPALRTICNLLTSEDQDTEVFSIFLTK